MSALGVAVQDGILVLTLSDLKNGNALSLVQAEALHSAVVGRAKDCAGVLVRAEGRLFCAGGNLRDYAGMSKASEGVKVNRRIAAIMESLSREPVPTVAAVGGDCFGGGLEFLSVFDHVIAAPHVYFGFWQRKVGLSFGWGGGERLAERLGAKKLRSLALEARTFNAHEALNMGLVDQIAYTSSLEAEAARWISRQRELPRLPLAPLKSWTASNESKAFEGLWWNDEHRSILKKF